MPESNSNAGLVRLAAARDPLEAHLWRQTLEERWIRCQVVGEYLGGFRVVPAGYPVPEIWVRHEDVGPAREILDHLPRR